MVRLQWGTKGAEARQNRDNDHVVFMLHTYMARPIGVQAGLNDGIPGLTNSLIHLNVAYRRCGIQTLPLLCRERATHLLIGILLRNCDKWV